VAPVRGAREDVGALMRAEGCAKGRTYACSAVPGGGKDRGVGGVTGMVDASEDPRGHAHDRVSELIDDLALSHPG
jgi:hypothetical protein